MCARIAVLLLSLSALALGSVSPTLGQRANRQRFELPKKPRLDGCLVRDAEARKTSSSRSNVVTRSVEKQASVRAVMIAGERFGRLTVIACH